MNLLLLQQVMANPTFTYIATNPLDRRLSIVRITSDILYLDI
jgi:hypothetical protein